MPIFSTLGVASKEMFGSAIDIASVNTVLWAVDEAQALGQILLSLKNKYPETDGWKHRVQATVIDTKWLQGIIDYEKSLTAGKG